MNIVDSFVRRWSSLVALVALAGIAGCMKSDPPRFRQNTVAMDLNSAGIPPAERQNIANILEAMFGTPDTPFVPVEAGLDMEKIRLAAGPVRVDDMGVERGLYRRHCGHCHGTTGDGFGPTAAVLNPYPRDYRPGIYKFKSTERGSMPTDEDLRRIIHYGIMDTAMPAFDVMLSGPQTDAFIEYVKYLSMRGMVEFALIAQVADLGEGDKLPTDRESLIATLKGVSDLWADAKNHVVAVTARPQLSAADEAKSIDKGKELFYGKANCAKCHGWSALGDGQTTDYDDWNKPLYEAEKTIGPTRESIAKSTDLSAADRAQKLAYLNNIEQAVHSSLPIRTIKPRNLREGYYRGGRRPLDLYRRVSVGIRGVPMPGVGPATAGAQGQLSEEEIWNLIDYVRSLPYESISKPPRPTSGENSRPVY